jgi:putative ABC transport system substrate-binding protein
MTLNVVRLVTLVLSLVLMPPAADAQRSAPHPPVIGRIFGGTAESSRDQIEAFRQGLRDFGYIEGKNIIVEYRFAEGRMERHPDLLRELVQRPVDVIAVSGYQGMAAAKQATSMIPIVGVACDHPEFLVSSIAQPDGNVTGVTCMSSGMSTKRVEFLKELLPDLVQIAFLHNPQDPGKAFELRDVRAAADALGITILPVEVTAPDGFEAAFALMARQRAQALIVAVDLFTYVHRQRIVDFAAAHRMPGIYGFRQFTDAGGLLSYGANLLERVRYTARFIDKLLKGEKPGQLPIDQPTIFELVINLRTARALGIEISPALLARADEVIE